MTINLITLVNGKIANADDLNYNFSTLVSAISGVDDPPTVGDVIDDLLLDYTLDFSQQVNTAVPYTTNIKYIWDGSKISYTTITSGENMLIRFGVRTFIVNSQTSSPADMAVYVLIAELEDNIETTINLHYSDTITNNNDRFYLGWWDGTKIHKIPSYAGLNAGLITAESIAAIHINAEDLYTKEILLGDKLLTEDFVGKTHGGLNAFSPPTGDEKGVFMTKEGDVFFGSKDAYMYFDVSTGEFTLKGNMTVDVPLPTLDPKGVWNFDTTYYPNDLVFREPTRASYSAILESAGKSPETFPAYWQQLVEAPVTPSIYFLTVNGGTIIKNGLDEVSINVTKLTDDVLDIMDSGNIKMHIKEGGVYYPISDELNGLDKGSDYSATFDSDDIDGNLVIYLRDSVYGTEWDSVRLLDVIDGEQAEPTVYGYFTKLSGKMHNAQNADKSWPDVETEVRVDFYKGGTKLQINDLDAWIEATVEFNVNTGAWELDTTETSTNITDNTGTWPDGGIGITFQDGFFRAYIKTGVNAGISAGDDFYGANAGNTGLSGTGFNWSGSWSGGDGVAYSKDDVVSYNGETYIALQTISETNNSPNPSSNKTYWDLYVERGKAGTSPTQYYTHVGYALNSDPANNQISITPQDTYKWVAIVSSPTQTNKVDHFYKDLELATWARVVGPQGVIPNYVQPTHPYFIGDLWYKDIGVTDEAGVTVGLLHAYRCTTDSTTEFIIDHWTRITQQVDSVITDWLYAGDIDADNIKTGTLTYDLLIKNHGSTDTENLPEGVVTTGALQAQSVTDRWVSSTPSSTQDDNKYNFYNCPTLICALKFQVPNDSYGTHYTFSYSGLFVEKDGSFTYMYARRRIGEYDATGGIYSDKLPFFTYDENTYVTGTYGTGVEIEYVEIINTEETKFQLSIKCANGTQALACKTHMDGLKSKLNHCIIRIDEDPNLTFFLSNPEGKDVNIKKHNDKPKTQITWGDAGYYSGVIDGFKSGSKFEIWKVDMGINDNITSSPNVLEDAFGEPTIKFHAPQGCMMSWKEDIDLNSYKGKYIEVEWYVWGEDNNGRPLPHGEGVATIDVERIKR